MAQTELKDILSDVHNCFGFLFERGLKVGRTNFLSSGMWYVELISSKISIEIACDRLEITLRIGRRDEEKWFGLFEIVYLLSDKKEFIGIHEEFGNEDVSEDRIRQLQRFGKILYKYLDEITAFFGENFERNKNDLQSIRTEVRELYTKAIREKLARMKLL